MGGMGHKQWKSSRQAATAFWVRSAVTSVYEALLHSLYIWWQIKANFVTPSKPNEITQQGYFLILLA